MLFTSDSSLTATCLWKKTTHTQKKVCNISLSESSVPLAGWGVNPEPWQLSGDIRHQQADTQQADMALLTRQVLQG